MHKIEIPDKKIIIDLPSEIDEMTNKQFVRYLFHVLQYISGKINEDQFKIILVNILLDIRGTGFRYHFKSQEKKAACETNLARISELMECFIEEHHNEGRPVREFMLKSVRNFVPRILNYYGPESCFENLTYCEYRTARGFFKAFAQENKEDDLNHLVAVLYRPTKILWCIRKYFGSSDGEKRIPFKAKSNPIYLLRRVIRISRFPYHLRYAVFIYFSACEDYLKTGKPKVDGNELDFSKLYMKEEDGSTKADVGLVGLLYSLTETGVFGNIEQTDNTNLWDIMIRLYQVVMQMQEMEEKSKKT